MSADPRQTTLLWGAVVVAVGLLGPLMPWPVAASALFAALVAALLRREGAARFAAGLVALAGAPYWGAALRDGGSWEMRALAAASGLLLLLTSQPSLPRALPWVLLGVGLVEAARQAAASLNLPAALAGAWGLALVALGVAGDVAAARRAPACLAALGLVGVVGLGRAGLAASQAPETEQEVRRAAELGVLGRHADALASRPGLALEGLRADPSLHALALSLLPTLGPQALLEVGWRAEQAPLSADQRVEIARALDASGQGGRAIRVLRPGRGAPEVAWRLALLERQTGAGRTWEGPPPPSLLAAPPERWRLPGRVELGWEFLTNGGRTVELHAIAEVGALSLVASGQATDAPARVEVRLDDHEAVTLDLPSAPGALLVARQLDPGPHRLEVRFVNDAFSSAGDRNASILAVVGEAR